MKKRNIILAISIPILFFSCLIICYYFLTIHYSNKKINDTRIKSIGSYCLDLTKSEIKLGAKDSSCFKNLTFILSCDSFKFSRKIPFTTDSIGIWEMEYIPPAVYILLKFKAGDEWQIGPGDNYINMPYQDTIEEYPKAFGRLYFFKKN